jgi:hypothetical protein
MQTTWNFSIVKRETNQQILKTTATLWLWPDNPERPGRITAGFQPKSFEG